MSKQPESHPWMIGLSIGSALAAILVILAGVSLLRNADHYASPGALRFIGVGFIIVAAFVLWGITWISKISDSYRQWSSVPGTQKLLGYLLMLPGIFFGILIALFFSAIGYDPNRRS